MNLQPGQNAPLPGPSFDLLVTWDRAPSGVEIDLSCFALGGDGKVRSDDDFVFFNAPELAGGGVRYDAGAQRFSVDVARAPGGIEKLVFALTLTAGQTRGQNVGMLESIEVRTAGEGALVFPLATGGRSEVALILCEVYLRNGQWKLRAIGQGYNGGLAPLAQSFGVDISEGEGESAAPPPPPAPAPPPARPDPRGSGPPPGSDPRNSGPEPTRVNLSKVTLDKRGSSVSLEKKGGDFGQVVINLNWDQRQSGGGGLRKLFGGNRGIDLDLGCLIELADGEKGAVQALGNSFGDLNGPPFIRLDGDDRTGASAAGETLRINGTHWDKVRRVLVYAFIYEGVPNWAEANAVVSVNAPGQSEIEVRLDSTSGREGMCAIALVENERGNLKITKQVMYFPSHMEMDHQFAWGLNWRAGSKD